MDIHKESAANRAVRELRSAVHSLKFFFWFVLCEAVGLALTVVLSQAHSVGAQVVIAVAVFLAAAVFATALVFLPLWITAPVRQRDQARETARNLRGEGASIPYSEARMLAESALQKGDAYLARLRASVHPDETSAVYAELNPWFTETFYDLRRYSELWAQPFGSASGTGFSDIAPHDRELLESNLAVKVECIRSLLQHAERQIGGTDEA